MNNIILDTNLEVAYIGLLVVYTLPLFRGRDNHNNERVNATIAPTTGIPETTRMALLPLFQRQYLLIE